ncbi:MAG: hypothetical protein ACRCWG_15495 [Sarcina sp.]
MNNDNKVVELLEILALYKNLPANDKTLVIGFLNGLNVKNKTVKEGALVDGNK